MSEQKLFYPLKKDIDFNKKVAGFDIETAGSRNEFVLACIVGDDIHEVFRSIEDLKTFLLHTNKARNYIFISTNLGFDFLGSFMNDPQRWEISEQDGHIYSFKLYQNVREVNGCIEKKNPIKFLDTINYYPASVETLGENLGHPKLGHPACFKRRPKNEKEFKELERYCSADAYISYEFFKKRIITWIKEFQISLSSTIASTSLKTFRKSFLKDTYQISKPKIHNLVFDAYYGGRTEVFKRGYFKDVICFDYNSMYPAVMRNKLPDPNSARYSRSVSLFEIKNREGVCHIRAKVPVDKYIPLLPLRTEDKLLFPVGYIEGFYTFLELREALKRGLKIEHIGEGVVYTKTCKPFDDFVNEMYNRRLRQKRQNNPMQLMTKLVLNSLYGKFAYNYRESNILIPKHQAKKDHYEKAVKITEIDDFLGFKLEDGEPCSYSIPIWSCYITAYARLKLHRAISDPKLRENILYCDTDSLFLSNSSYCSRHIKTSERLGDLDLEDDYPVQDAIFIRPKFYKTKKPKIKGFSECDSTTFDKLVSGQKIKREQFIKFRSAIRSKESHKWGKLKVNQIIEKEKSANLQDNKRDWSHMIDLLNENQDSKPLFMTTLMMPDKNVSDERLHEINQMMGSSIHKDIQDFEDDISPFKDKGNDITEKEYLENEIFMAMLE